MTDPSDVFLTSVLEAYRRIEHLVLVSLGSSVWLLIVGQVNPKLAPGTPVPRPELPLGLSGDVPLVWLALIALAAYVVSGVLILLYYRKSRRALNQLRRGSQKLFEAVGTFPSLAALSPVPRLLAFGALGAIGLLAICLLHREPGDALKGLWAGIFLSAPYVILFVTAFLDAVPERRSGGSAAKGRNS